MASKNGNVKEIWGRKFSIIKNGLDEKEVYAFIGSLIDQNNEYTKKLEHLEYLSKLGENTVIEADKEAEKIKILAREKATEDANTLVIQASEEARSQAMGIITEAEEASNTQAERIIREAEHISLEKLAALENLARDIVKTAEVEAKRRARNIQKQAKREALNKKREAEDLIVRSRQLAESEIKARFEKVYRDMLASLEPQNAEADKDGETEF